MPFITKLGSVAARAYGWLATTVAVTANDVYFYLVSMLLPGNGTNGAQNNTFLDSSTNNFTITRNGNTTQGTFSPFSQTGWSNYFDGTGDYLSVPRNAALLPVANENFTVEAWVYLTAAPSATTAQIVGFGEYGTDSDWVFSINPSLQTTFYINAIITTFTATTTITINSWNHVAVSRSGTGANNLKIFVNGVGQSFTTNSTTVGTGNRALSIGADQNGDESAFPGFISNLRLVKGTAVYTANFTPPTAPLTAISGTSLLTCQSNRFVDNSVSNFTITRNGDTSVTANSPFAPNNFTPASYSGWFDGTGDYLSIANNSAFAPAALDFTIEAWVYINALTAGSQTIFGQADSAGTVGSGIYFYACNASGFPQLASPQGGSNNLLTSTTAIAIRQWNHIAVARYGAIITIYVNGIASGTINFGALALTASTQINSIGRNGAGNFEYLNGYISNFRFVKGTAVYTANFTPPTAPLTAISGTSLLTCQNATFIDNSTNAFAITVNGNAQPVTSNPFGVTTTQPVAWSAATNGGSGYFDGTGDYLTFPQNAAFNLATVDFTMEGWVYYTSTPAAGPIFSIDTTSYPSLLIQNESGVLKAYATSASTSWDILNGASFGSISANAWAHFALTRSGSTFRTFLNGALVTTVTSSAAIENQGGTGRVGASDVNVLLGYLSSFRIVRGTALYTSNFTPPLLPFTAIANTSLLLNYTNAGIYDAASQNVLETIGNAQISTAQSKWGGGSMAFDGAGDYLTVPDSPAWFLGTGNFTIEFWIYFSSTASLSMLVQQGLNANNRWILYYSTTTGMSFDVASASAGIITCQQGSTAGWATNTWYHVALVRNGNAFNIYRNGTSIASATDTDSIPDFAGPLYIGGGAFPGDVSLNGYIDDLRITKFARYTANFTPPTAAFPTQ